MYIVAGDGVLVGSRTMIFKNPSCSWNIFIFRLRAFAAAQTMNQQLQGCMCFFSLINTA